MAILIQHIISSLPWYLIRAFGLISAALLIILIISGVGLITGFTFKLWEPIKAWAVHKALAIAFVFSLLGHILFLLVDSYQRYTITMILVPFLGSTPLTLGILAMYLLIITVISSLMIIDTKKYLWKAIHLLSYLAIVFVYFHALNMGTDLRSGWLRDAWIGFGILIIFSMIARLFRTGTVNK